MAQGARKSHTYVGSSLGLRALEPPSLLSPPLPPSVHQSWRTSVSEKITEGFLEEVTPDRVCLVWRRGHS